MQFNKHKYQHILVLGAGESGTGAAMLAKKLKRNVFVSDSAKIGEKYRTVLNELEIPFEERGHHIEQRKQVDLVIVSPGIPPKAPVFLKIEPKIPVVSEIEFASWFTEGKIIGITGSNGKTTTTLLTGHILQKAGVDAFIAGNIGTSFSAELSRSDHAYFVIELSSFQLDNIFSFRPDIALLTNITADHLDRYNNDFELYAEAKMRIGMNQRSDDAFIYCADDPMTIKMIEKHPPKAKTYPFSLLKEFSENGAYIRNKEIHFKTFNTHTSMTIEELALQGKHNLYNSLASGLAAQLVHIRKESLRASFADYQNVEHRLEYVANVHGVSYYNDSKATNVNATWYALEYFDRPILWIAGGLDKGNDYTALIPLARQKVKVLICLGKDNQKLHETFENVVDQIIDTDSAEQAVLISSLLSQKNDVVLLSPACASFDLFENFEDRGNQFKAAVRSL